MKSIAAIFAAIIAVAALTGAVLVADSVDAVEDVQEEVTEPAETTGVYVKYIIGETTYTQKVEGTTITLMTVSELGAALPAGYAFDGWVKGATASDSSLVLAAGSTVAVDEADTQDANTYTAKTSLINYTVTFEVDGKVIDTQEGTVEDTYSAPADPVKDGWLFDAWTVDGAAVDTPKDVKFSADVDYVATFTEDFAIEFSIDGIVIDGGTVSDIRVPSDPTKEGNVFKGWSLDGTTVVDPTKAEITEDSVFVAVFDPIDCAVTFVSEGQTVLTQSVKYGSTIVEPALVPAKEGYEFVGWTVDGELYDFAAPVTGPVTLTAAFEEIVVPVDYPVFFVIDGTSISGGTVSKMVVPDDPTKEGYVFVGWAIDGEVVDLADIAATADGPVTLTASWRVMTYTVTFVSEGETVWSQTVQYEGLVTEPAMVPVRDGYDFGGWTVDGKAYDFATPVTGPVTLTAAWAETPEPAPTGLSDPMTLTLAVIVGILVVALLSVGVWQRQAIMSKASKILGRKAKAETPKEDEKK